MAFTIAEFGHIALAAMHRLGVRYTAAELDDIYHFWRYVALLNGLTRAFLGDSVAAALGVPDTAIKHLPTVVGPVVGGINRVLAAVPGANALRTRRALANRSRVMIEQRARYGMTHDLVDTAPSAGERHPAAG